MPRNDRNKPEPTRSKTLVPVVLMKKFRGFNPGEAAGFKPQTAADLVTSKVARWYDDEARQMAERAGFKAEAKAAAMVDAEVQERAEKLAHEIAAPLLAAAEEKMAAVVSANKKGGEAHAKFEAALAKKDEEIAKLMEELAKKDG